MPVPAPLRTVIATWNEMQSPSYALRAALALRLAELGSLASDMVLAQPVPPSTPVVETVVAVAPAG
jgi:hypothetical protein